MESHQYNGSAYGNFSLVLAAVHTKARFLWDGEKSVLRVEYQESRIEAATEIWKHDAFISVLKAENVFAEIGSNAETMLS